MGQQIFQPFLTNSYSFSVDYIFMLSHLLTTLNLISGFLRGTLPLSTIMITQIIAIVIFIFIPCYESTPIGNKLQPSQSFCFSQDLPRHSLVIIDAFNENLPFLFEIFYVREVLHNVTTSEQYTHSFTTQNYGIYKFCLTNLAQRQTTIWFEFRNGLKANDFGSHSENQDYMDSIENQADIAELFIKQIKDENQQGLEIMSEAYQSYYGPGAAFSVSYFFSTIFVGATMLLAYIQFKIIKNHMVARKYI